MLEQRQKNVNCVFPLLLLNNNALVMVISWIILFTSYFLSLWSTSQSSLHPERQTLKKEREKKKDDGTNSENLLYVKLLFSASFYIIAVKSNNIFTWNTSQGINKLSLSNIE